MAKQPASIDIFSDQRIERALSGVTADAPPPKISKPVRPAAVRPRPAAKPAAPTAPVQLDPAPEVAPSAPKSATLRFRVSKDMRVAFQRFKAELSAALGGVVLDDSNLGRALFLAVLEGQGDAILDAARASNWDHERPASSDGSAMAAFDAALAEVIGAGL